MTPPISAADQVPVPRSDPKHSASLAIGYVLADFVIVGVLGRGAYSTVYRVRSATNAPSQRPATASRSRATTPSSRIPHGTDYALKILVPSLIDSASALTAFRREAAMLASVGSSGLPRVHEVGMVDGLPYLVMDLVEGRSLEEVEAEGVLTPQQIVSLALDIADSLAALHRRGLVHRDLKPPNVMILANGQARLVDFGLTARGDLECSPSVVGTLAYAAPEQSGMLKRPVDNRSDLYSLGVILFEALAGQLPFESADVGELLRMHAVVPAEDLCELIDEMPRKLAAVVARLLSKDPDDRYQDAESLAIDLRLYQAGDRVADPDLQEIKEQNTAQEAGRPAAQPPLNGRHAELQRIASRWNLAREGHGGVAVVRGEGGIGKSRLVREAADVVEAAGGLVLRGRAILDDPVPFAPLYAALEHHFEAALQMVGPQGERTRAQLRRACPIWSLPVLSQLTPALGAVLSGCDTPFSSAEPLATKPTSGAPIRTNVQDATTHDVRSEGAEGQNRVAAAVAGLLLGLAVQGSGLLLVLDDMQWLDAGSLRVLSQLRAALPSTPLLLLGTVRPDEMGAGFAEEFIASLGEALNVNILLTALDEAEVAAQIQSLMPGLSMDARLVGLLQVRSNGNPFMVQEYLRAIVDAGLLEPSWGLWVLDEDGLDALELPQDALSLVQERVQSLGPQTRVLLIAAAVIGQRFSPRLLATIQEIDQQVVFAALSEATRRSVIEPRDGEFRFLHNRIREALLAELTAAQAADLHQRIAQALEAMTDQAGIRDSEQVYTTAFHYLRCEQQVTPERVVAACSAAGQLALSHQAPAEAVTFLEHAATLSHPVPSSLVLPLSDALQRCGRLVEARQYLEHALETEPDRLCRAEMFSMLAGVHRANWNTAPALEAIEQGLGELSARPPRHPAMLWGSTLLMFAIATGREWTGLGLGSAQALRRRRSEMITDLHRVGGFISAVAMRPDLMLAHNLRALYWATQLGAGERYVLSQGSYGVICAWMGLTRSANRAFARAEADPAHTHPAVRALSGHFKGLGLYQAGLDNGEAFLRETQLGAEWLSVTEYLDSVSLLSTIACLQGRTQEAEHWLALGQCRSGGDSGGDVTTFLFAPAMTYALLGRAAEAGTELRRARELGMAHMDAHRLLATLFVLQEQEEYGEPFEEAVTEFEAMKLKPKMMIRVHRTIKYLVGCGRVAQLRSATDEQRPARLIAARLAVGQVQKAGNSDELQAWAQLTSSALLVLDGKPSKALEVLDGVVWFLEPCSPTLSFELARARARALAALGRGEEAHQQAGLAHLISLEQHWPHRAASVAIEFKLASSGRHTPTLSASRSSHSAGLERHRLQALQQVSVAASRVLDPGDLVRITLDETIRILAADRAFLFLIDTTTGTLVSHLGRDSNGHDVSELIGYSTSLVEQVRISGQPLVVTGTDEGAALGAESVVLHGLRSILVTPLQIEGRILGVIYLDSRVAKGIFTADDADILTALTNHIATSLETARAAQLEISVQTARHQQELADNLYRALQSMSNALDPADVITQLLAALADILGCENAWLLGSTEDGYSIQAADGPLGKLVQDQIAGDPALQALLVQKEPSSGTVDMIPASLSGRLGDEAAIWISLPLSSPATQLGCLLLTFHDVAMDLQGSTAVAATLAAQGIISYDKASLFAQVQSLAVTDELTGIANRRRFFEVASRDLVNARRHGLHIVALMVDIDHFKRVNDTHGHPVGDDVIRIVANRLNSQIRGTDILCRYGGEEFALLLLDINEVTDLPERLRACIADEPIITRIGPVPITISVGQASLVDQDQDVAALLARADQALYQAKSNGRNRVFVGS